MRCIPQRLQDHHLFRRFVLLESYRTGVAFEYFVAIIHFTIVGLKYHFICFRLFRTDYKFGACTLLCVGLQVLQQFRNRIEMIPGLRE